MEDFELELKKDFLDEAKGLLETAEKSFLQLENNPTNEVLINEIFRFAHNLKGTSRAVGFGQIAELTHLAENLLLKIKEKELIIHSGIMDVLFYFLDKVREMILGLDANLEAIFDYQDCLNKIEAALSGKIEKTDKTQENKPSEDSFPEEEESKISLVKEPSKKVKPTTNSGAAANTEETIRVSLKKIEDLNNLVGELVILQTEVEALAGTSGKETRSIRSLGKLCKEIQDLSMSLRMLPIGPTFQKLQRIVRDTSKTLEKKVDLLLKGEETEVDKTVLENLADPLVHLVRNAVDHGVELPQERLLANKSENGKIEVLAFHQGNFLALHITDDGKGIDPQVLRQKAIHKGIIKEEDNLTEEAMYQLIFAPGFSTKDQVSEVSGRGVGMDVVKTNVESMGGQVRVQSKLGVGSSIELLIPLTMAIIEGMLIEVSGKQFVVPQSQIQEVIKIDLAQAEKFSGKNPYYKLRDLVVPIFSLKRDLGLDKRVQLPPIALVVKKGKKFFAVGIDDLIKQQQIVVRPLTFEISHMKGAMGTTILGDGLPSVILDLVELYGDIA